MRETDKVYDPTAWSKLPLYGKFQQETQLCGLLDKTLSDDLQEGESVLDVGCGAGRLAHQFKRGYTGIDITPHYIELAKEKFPHLTWVLGDCRSLPFPDQSFDRTWSTNLLIHLPWDDIKVALNEMVRVTRKAIYLCSVFDDYSEVQIIPDDSKGIPFIYNRIPYEDLRIPGWTLESVGEGRVYVVMRKSSP
jgi:SAM-dependent methyltransferase